MRSVFSDVALVLAAFFIVLAPSIGDVPVSESNGQCEFDRSAILALDFVSFDQDFDGGWRRIASHDDCTLIAADLIRDYIDHHNSNERLLIFHEGQMRAKAGQTGRAIELIQSTREPDGENNFFGWNLYIDATVAFLEKDRDALVEARDALAALPKPSNFSARDRDGNPVQLDWPPNLGVVNGFVKCFSDTYDFAYDRCGGLFED